jgi:CubicO group peptidase (beta-lactamase class C family)
MLLRALPVFHLAVIAAGAELAPDVVARIETAVTAEMSRQSIPALSIAVAVENQLRWTAGYGISDLENFVPAKATTVFRLGSISKPITATALLQLEEQGRVDLDAPVQRYLPGFPLKEWPVTPRSLLSHLGGIRHYNGAEDFGSTRRYASVTEALGIFQNDELEHEPGTKYLYTTYGYSVLGAIVESVAGTPFIEYVRKHVFEPSGMERIRDDSHAALIPNRARGYAKDEQGRLRNCNLADTSNKIPGGGMAGTAGDLVRFALALNRGKLLRKATVERMFTRAATRDGKPVPYGLGVFVGEWEGRRLISHGGGQQGTSTLLQLYPESGAAIAIMCNLEGARLAPLAGEVARAILRAAPAGTPVSARQR